MGFTGTFTPVATLFAAQSHLDRSSITLFAQTHPEVRAVAVVSTGREVLHLLQNGLNPQVIVLDMQLRDPGIQTLICEIRAMHLVPNPRLLLSVPSPEQPSAEDALLTFRGQEVILRPYEMRTLFERVYLLGAGDEAAQLYRDNGPGLPPDALHLLPDGTWSQPLLAQGGLGLPLIRTYCAAMGWQISQPAGETGILFTLPTCQDSGTALRLYSASPEDTRRRRQMFLRELRGLSPESAEP